MPILHFRTNAVEHVVGGVKTNNDLTIKIDLDKIAKLTDPKALKTLLQQEIKNQYKIFVKIDNIKMSGSEINASTFAMIKNPKPGTDFTVNITRLTEQELNVLGIIKALKQEADENKQLIAKMSTAREVLLTQLAAIDAEIETLTFTSIEIREKILAKADELKRVIPEVQMQSAAMQKQTMFPARAETPVTGLGNQTGTMFAKTSPQNMTKDMKASHALTETQVESIIVKPGMVAPLA